MRSVISPTHSPIGPEVMESVQEIFQAASVPIEWDVQMVQFKEVDPRTNSFITRENLDAVLVCVYTVAH